MKKNLLAVVALVGALTIGLVAPQAATAYPSGSNLQVSATKDPFRFRSYTRISISNAIPNQNVSISVVGGATAKFFPRKTNGSGSVSWLFWPYRAGKFTINVTSGSETKSVVVYSTSAPKFPRRVSIRKSFNVSVKYVTPGTAVSLVMNGSPVTGIGPEVADANGNVSFTIPAGTINKGSNWFRLSVGSHYVTGNRVYGTR